MHFIAAGSQRRTPTGLAMLGRLLKGGCAEAATHSRHSGHCKYKSFVMADAHRIDGHISKWSWRKVSTSQS